MHKKTPKQENPTRPSPATLGQPGAGTQPCHLWTEPAPPAISRRKERRNRSRYTRDGKQAADDHRRTDGSARGVDQPTSNGANRRTTCLDLQLTTPTRSRRRRWLRPETPRADSPLAVLSTCSCCRLQPLPPRQSARSALPTASMPSACNRAASGEAALPGSGGGTASPPSSQTTAMEGEEGAGPRGRL